MIMTIKELEKYYPEDFEFLFTTVNLIIQNYCQSKSKSKRVNQLKKVFNSNGLEGSVEVVLSLINKGVVELHYDVKKEKLFLKGL